MIFFIAFLKILYSDIIIIIISQTPESNITTDSF